MLNPSNPFAYTAPEKFTCEHCGHPDCSVGLWAEYVLTRMRIACPQCNQNNYVRIKLTVERLRQAKKQ